MRNISHFQRNLLLTVVLVLGLAACAAPAAPTAIPPTTAPQPTSAPTIAPTAMPPTTAPTTVPTAIPPTPAPTTAPTTAPGGITLSDSTGRSVTLVQVPARIVSLAPSNTEMVCALGACDKLIAIDQFSDYPAQVRNLPKVSDGFNPNYEQIVAAKPDLVLVAAISSPDVVKKFDELHIPALVVGNANSSFKTIEQDITLVGKALGADKQATDVIAGMETKLAALKTKLTAAKTKPRVFWELDATDPSKPFTSGPGTFVDEIITLGMGENIASKATSPYVQLSAEEIIQANPQIIIMSDAAYGVAPDSVGKRPGWDGIEAVKKKRVLPIDDNLVSRPGPRVVAGLEAAAKLIHPELFAATAQTYTDPFGYCSAVGTIDTPDASYTGERVPPTIADGLRKAFGGSTMPDAVLVPGTFWRCMDGQVYACNVGANIPCESKANTNKTPTQAETDYCKQNPTVISIPAVVTGHDTIYEWACKNGAPEIVKQVMSVDPQGFATNFWYKLSK